MGYEIEIYIDTKIKKNKIIACRERIKNAKHSKMCESFGGCYVEEFLDGIMIHEDGEIELEDSYGNWDNWKGFIIFLLPFVEAGDIEFTGEDHEKWGYHFDGKGKAYEIYWTSKIRKEPIYDYNKILLEAL